MYLGLDNHMMFAYEGGGGADTLRSPSSYNITPEFEEIQVLKEFRPDVNHGPDAYSKRWRTRFHADGGQCSTVMADTVPR